jgi:dienelactone hydrolase
VFFDNGLLPLATALGTTMTRSWGVISTPTDGQGPFPLVVVLHGAHAYCSTATRSRQWPCPDGTELPNHDGLSYLTDTLARSGFAAIAIGMNEEYAQLSSEPGVVTAALLERDVIAPLRAGKSQFAAVNPAIIVTRSLSLVGHSRGGAIAGVLAQPRSFDSVSGSGPPLQGLSIPVEAVVMLAPTSDNVDPSRLPDVPTAIVLGTCDNDTGIDGGDYLTAALTQVRISPVALMLMEGATHNAINERLDTERMTQDQPGCNDGQRLSAERQRSRLEDLVPNALRALIGLSTEGPVASLFADARTDDRVAAGLRFVHLDPTSAVKRLVDPLVAWPPPGLAVLGFSGAVQCPAGRSSALRNSGSEGCFRVELSELVGHPGTVHLMWTNGSPSLRMTVPSTSVGTVLVLRAFADPFSNPGATAVAVRVAASNLATTAEGWISEWEIPVATVGPPIGSTSVRRGAVLWSERRVVLPAGTITIELRMVGPAAGALDLVGVDLVTSR